MPQLKIQNVISTANLKQCVDARKFNHFSWGRYDMECYRGRCGYIKDKAIEGRVSVFLSGKMISTGGKSVSMSIRQLDHTMDLLTKNKLARRVLLEYKIQNIVATLDLKRALDVKSVIRCLDNYTYEPVIKKGRRIIIAVNGFRFFILLKLGRLF